MQHPAISVVLPAFNCQEYLSLAIESILNQTFVDFELLVINDGSTDETENIILSYSDARIRYLKNDKNSGLIFTLNKGIDAARGKYLARMDADDICLPGRFEQQYRWLEQHSKTSVVGSLIVFIDEQNKATGSWADDLATPDFKSIKSNMAWANCIAHPSIMMRTEVAKQYGYSTYQKNIEDFDLWLRLLADGHIIEKVPEVLLKYRVHGTSVTGSILRKSNPFFKQFNCKRKFLWHRISNGKWGFFETKVKFTMLFDGIMGIGKQVKNLLKF